MVNRLYSVYFCLKDHDYKTGKGTKSGIKKIHRIVGFEFYVVYLYYNYITI